MANEFRAGEVQTDTIVVVQEAVTQQAVTQVVVAEEAGAAAVPYLSAEETTEFTRWIKG